MSRKVDQAALRNLVEAAGLPLKQNKRSWLALCPKCDKPKLYIQKSNGACKCMKCGNDFKGWADYVLAEVLGRTRDELRELLYEGVAPGTAPSEDDVGLVDHWDEFTDDEDEVVLEVEKPLPPPIVWDPDIVDLDRPAGAKGLAYLERRGIPLDVAKKYGVRYNPREKRVCFPVVVDGVMRGWQARYIDRTDFYTEDGQRVVIPKILTTGEVGGRVLMNQDALRGSAHAIMVEGPVDMVKCHLCGGETATMGKSFTPEQLRIYVKSGVKRLYCGLDDDADDAIMRVARELSPYLELYRLTTPPGREDLGASTPEEVYEGFRSAKRLNPGHIYSYWADPNDWPIKPARPSTAASPGRR